MDRIPEKMLLGKSIHKFGMSSNPMATSLYLSYNIMAGKILLKCPVPFQSTTSVTECNSPECAINLVTKVLFINSQNQSFVEREIIMTRISLTRETFFKMT